MPPLTVLPTRKIVRSLLILFMLSVPQLSLAIEPKTKTALIDYGIYDAESGTFYDVSRYVGFTPAFSRYPDGVVKIAYNHSNAPDGVSIEQVRTILQTAFSIIEGVADIDFQYQGETTAPDFFDDISDVGWFTEESNVAGTAGSSASEDSNLIRQIGYAPYISGGMDFNTVFGAPSMSTTVHELLHLLGLSHSDDPVSIMRPETSRFDLPQADDIAALQAMYGPPDVLVVPRNTIDLDSSLTTSKVQLSLSDSFFDIQAADGSLQTIERLTSGQDDDFVSLSLSFTNGASTKIVGYLTDPNGHTNALQDIDLDIDAGTAFMTLDSFGVLKTIAGDWTVTVGSEGQQLGVFTLPVDNITSTDNQNPDATFASTNLGGGLYKFNVTASDPEGDDLVFKFNVPGRGEVLDSGSSIDITAQGPNPQIAFASVQDSGMTRSNDGLDNSGFGVLFSRYIVQPAEENIPTYYVQEKILHLPSLNAGGQVVSANLKLTGLPGAVFKLLEFDPMANFTGTAGASIDLATGKLTMPRVIISDNGATSALNDISMTLVADSQPVRFEVK